MKTLARMSALSMLLVALACAAWPSVARAAGSPVSGVTMSVQTGYGFAGGGNYRLSGPAQMRANDAWVPVFVTLRNTSGANVSGRLLIADGGASSNNSLPPARADYTLDVTLPAGAHKLVEMYARAADIGAQLAVNLTVGGGTVASQGLQATLQPAGNLSIGVLSDDTAARTILHSLTFGDAPLSVTQFGDATPLDTQPQALSNFDLIVATNYASDALSSAQMAALRAWVQGGGTLLVAGGPDALKTMGHLAPDLMPVTINPAATTAVAPSLPELAAIAGTAASPGGQVEYSVAAPRAGAVVLARHGSVPLAVELPYGRGTLVYSAVEPTLAPFDGWSLTAQSAFWGHLLGGALSGPVDSMVQGATQSNQGNSGNTPSNILSDLNAPLTRSLPSMQIYAFLIVLYIIIIGPGNFALLRWLRRLELSWLTIPAVAIVFGVGAFGLAYARNGGDVLAHIDSVVYLDPGSSTKLADSYVGIFAPYPGDYQVSSPNAALAWGIGSDDNSTLGATPLGSAGRPLRIDEGTPFNAWLYGMQMWSMRSLGMRQQINLPGGVSARLAVRGGLVVGDVTNNTKLTLHDCVVVAANGASQTIATLAPGQTVRVTPFPLNSGGTTTLPSSGTGPLNTLYAALVGGAGGLQAAGGQPLAQATRYNAVLTTIFPNGSMATAAAPLSLIGWSADALSPLTVNGATPHRTDLNLFVAPLSLGAAPGRINLAPGALPLSVVGTTAAPIPGSGSGISLNPGDHIDLQLALPNGGRRIAVDTLDVEISGSTITPGNAELWDWTAQRWTAIDVSTGSWQSRRAGRFAAPNGRVWLRLLAPSSGNLSFSNIGQSVGVGATARVGP